MRKILVITLLIISLSLEAKADRIYLKNGGKVDGLINKEDGGNVELDMGSGTVVIRKDDIKSIDRSTPEEAAELIQGWGKAGEELKSKEKEFLEERERRFNEYGQWTKEMREKKMSEAHDSKEVKIARDADLKGILVEVVLNQAVRSTLVLDTGASLIVLSRKKGEELGIDLSDEKKDVLELRLVANRTVKAKVVILKSVRIGDVEEKDVKAAILLEDVVDIGLKDGLLGQSFLSRFSIKIDLKTMKMTLEKLQ